MTISHKRLAELCLDSYHVSTFSVDDVEVLYFPINGYNVVVIRGTELNEWRDLFRVAFADYRNAAHKVARKLVQRLNHSLPTVLAGHSAGGCIALHLSQLIDSNEVVTFGAPRISLLGEGVVTSYVHGNDMIPKLLYPFCWTSGEKRTLAKNKQKWYKYSIKDHLLQGYIENL